MLRKILTTVAAIGTIVAMVSCPVMAQDANSGNIKWQKGKGRNAYSAMLWYNGRKWDSYENGIFRSGISEFNSTSYVPTGRSILDNVTTGGGSNHHGTDSVDSIKKKGYAYLEFIDRYTQNDDGEGGGDVAKRTFVRIKAFRFKSRNHCFFIRNYSV